MFGKPTTVEGAIAPLLKTLENLRMVGANLGVKMTQNADTVVRLQDESEAHSREYDRAITIAKKLAEIVGE